MRAGDYAGDLGEAVIGLAVVGKTTVDDGDAVALPLPLPHEDCSGLDAPRQHDFAWGFGVLGDQLVELSRRRSVQTAIGLFLDAVGEASAQEIWAKGLGRIGFELRAPERAKSDNRHGAKLIELGLDHGVGVVRHQAARLAFDGVPLAGLPVTTR